MSRVREAIAALLAELGVLDAEVERLAEQQRDLEARREVIADAVRVLDELGVQVVGTRESAVPVPAAGEGIPPVPSPAPSKKRPRSAKATDPAASAQPKSRKWNYHEVAAVALAAMEAGDAPVAALERKFDVNHAYLLKKARERGLVPKPGEAPPVASTPATPAPAALDTTVPAASAAKKPTGGAGAHVR